MSCQGQLWRHKKSLHCGNSCQWCLPSLWYCSRGPWTTHAEVNVQQKQPLGSMTDTSKQKRECFSQWWNKCWAPPHQELLNYEYHLLLIDMDVQNATVFVFLQYTMLSTNVSKAMCAWMETSLEQSCHSTEEHTSLSTALKDKWEPRGESEDKQTLILFKEELSNNLCSPKMELADLEDEVFQQSWVAICQGRGSRPSTQHGDRLDERVSSSMLNWLQLMKKLNTGQKVWLIVSIWGFVFSFSKNWRKKMIGYSKKFLDNSECLLCPILLLSI